MTGGKGEYDLSFVRVNAPGEILREIAGVTDRDEA